MKKTSNAQRPTSNVEHLTAKQGEFQIARQRWLCNPADMMHRIITLVTVVWSLSTASAFTSDIPKKTFHLNEKIEKEIGYAQAIRIGDTLYISGSVGTGEMPVAIRESYDELKKTLAAHGLDFRNVVKENVFTTDLDAFKKNKDVRKEYYGAECPAATWVQVQRLYLPSFVVEVELIAVFPR